MDRVFFLTLLFIFLSALIGAFMKRRARDRCLEDFADFHVTVVMKSGARAWGSLLLFPKGIELLYATPHCDAKGHVETSTLFFPDQMAKVQVVYRFRDELTAAQRKRRHEEIERTYHPNFIRRTWRHLRNFVNTFRDAFGQTISVLVAQVQRTPAAASSVLKTQDKRLTEMGQTILGAVPNAYEPMLERYIGRRVVAQEVRDGVVIEHAGVLKEYTAAWIEILDCLITQEHIFDLSEPGQLQVNRALNFIIGVDHLDGVRRLRIHIENRGQSALRVLRLEGEDYAHAFDRDIPPGGESQIVAGDLPEDLFPSPDALEGAAVRLCLGEDMDVTLARQLPNVRLVLDMPREGDLCLPRTHATVRHGGEYLDP